MTLASGAQIAFKTTDGSAYYEFDLAEEIGAASTLIRPHYEHRWEPIFATRTDTSGRPGTQNLVPEFPLWTANTDWSGGEGVKFVTDSKTQWNKYDNGTGNPRYPGQFQGPPLFTAATVIAGSWAGRAVVGVGKNLWTNTATRVFYTSNVTSWTEATTDLPASNSFVGDGAAGSDFVYLPYHANVSPTTTTILRTSTSGHAIFSTAISDANTYALAYQSNNGAFLYAWDGTKILQYDATATPTVAGTKVYSTGLASPPTTVAAVTTDNSVCFMLSDGSRTEVHEWKDGAGRVIWKLIPGFTGLAMGHSLGVLYVTGTFDNQAVLFGMSMADRVPQFLGYIRQTVSSSLTPVSIAPGFGAQMLIGMTTGEIFVYDQEQDSISLLDSVTASASVATLGMKRTALFASGGSLLSRYWNDDIATTNRSGQYVTAAYDYDIPEENKTLLGFYADFSPLSGSQTVQIEYQTNENGVWTSAGTIGIATANATSGFAYLTVSAAPTFRILRLRVTVVGGAILYAITARAYILNYIEKWEMVLRLKDELATQSAATGTPTRPTSRQVRAEVQRDYLIGNGTGPYGITGLINLKQPVTLLDGYHYGTAKDGEFTTHTVMIELPQDQIHKAGQGIMRIQCRSVAP